MFKSTDRTNRIIAAGEKCIVPTSQCFWKDPCDIGNRRVKATFRAKNEPTISYKELDDYVSQGECIKRWVLGIEQKNN